MVLSKGYGLVSLEEGEDFFVRHTDVRRRTLGISEVRAVRSELGGGTSMRRAVLVFASITVAFLLALLLASASVLASGPLGATLG